MISSSEVIPDEIRSAAVLDAEFAKYWVRAVEDQAHRAHERRASTSGWGELFDRGGQKMYKTYDE